MGLAKKGTNTITVDGTVYRWVVSGNDGFLDLLVELADVNGQRVEVQFDYDFGDMTPGTVRQIILGALDKGWTPARAGKQMRFSYADCNLKRWEENKST